MTFKIFFIPDSAKFEKKYIDLKIVVRKFLENVWDDFKDILEKISKKYCKILDVVGNFENIISNFWETSGKRDILEKSWKNIKLKMDWD